MNVQEPVTCADCGQEFFDRQRWGYALPPHECGNLREEVEGGTGDGVSYYGLTATQKREAIERAQQLRDRLVARVVKLEGVKGTLLKPVGPASQGDAVTVTDEGACVAHDDHRLYAIRDDRWEWPVGYLCGSGLDGVVEPIRQTTT